MAGIVLTIEELRPNISSKFSDSRKNPIKRILRKRVDASVQPFGEFHYVRHSTVNDEPAALLTLEASRQRRGFESEFSAAARPAWRRINPENQRQAIPDRGDRH